MTNTIYQRICKGIVGLLETSPTALMELDIPRFIDSYRASINCNDEACGVRPCKFQLGSYRPGSPFMRRLERELAKQGHSEAVSLENECE